MTGNDSPVAMPARLRRLLPAGVRRRLRSLIAPALDAARQRAVRRCVGAIRREAAAGLVSTRTIARLRAAWGNEGYTADVAFLAAVAGATREGRGPFLDCGSGLTTIVAGAIADVTGARVHSLEQDEAWHAELVRVLDACGIRGVDARFAPLREYDGCAWYDIDGLGLPAAFSHVFCDGPAIHKHAWPPPVFARWRAGLVPVLRSRGILIHEILLDDAEDTRSGELCAHWQALGLEIRTVNAPTGAWIHAAPRAPAVT